MSTTTPDSTPRRVPLSAHRATRTRWWLMSLANTLLVGALFYSAAVALIGQHNSGLPGIAQPLFVPLLLAVVAFHYWHVRVLDAMADDVPRRELKPSWSHWPTQIARTLLDLAVLLPVCHALLAVPSPPAYDGRTQMGVLLGIMFAVIVLMTPLTLLVNLSRRAQLRLPARVSTAATGVIVLVMLSRWSGDRIEWGLAATLAVLAIGFDTVFWFLMGGRQWRQERGDDGHEYDLHGTAYVTLAPAPLGTAKYLGRPWGSDITDARLRTLSPPPGELYAPRYPLALFALALIVAAGIEAAGRVLHTETTPIALGALIGLTGCALLAWVLNVLTGRRRRRWEEANPDLAATHPAETP